VRAAAPDHQPVAGRLAPGLFMLGGLGGRGFTLAPLLAAHVAALATGAPSPLPARLAALVAPQRFAPQRDRQGAGGRRGAMQRAHRPAMDSPVLLPTSARNRSRGDIS
jgi:tRNA 5-methylaminomethyl-2-thiouridine biosynthesis bifunctional protein